MLSSQTLTMIQQLLVCCNMTLIGIGEREPQTHGRSIRHSYLVVDVLSSSLASDYIRHILTIAGTCTTHAAFALMV